MVVEIKARGDERANIAWARKLEEAGCHVVYGFVGLKTHCKMVLIVREYADGSLRRFCHIGTGNYHPKTARLYEDFGLLTADKTVGEDVTDLFNHLTGYSRKSDYRRLLVAPERVRAGLVEQIEQQAQRSRDGLPARIRMKCNAIIDEATIDSLYRASQAGVPIDLWVRGIWPRAAAKASPACPRRSGFAASSAGSLSTRGFTPSAPGGGASRATSGSAAPISCTGIWTGGSSFWSASPTGRSRPSCAGSSRRRWMSARRPGGLIPMAGGPGITGTPMARPCAICRAT